MEKKWTWTGDDGKALEAAVCTMAANPDVGMLLSGNPGNGKTTAARLYAGKAAWFWDCNADDEDAQDFLRGDDRYVYVAGRNVIVDDLGAEREFREYGERRELMGEWLTGLYKKWAKAEWQGRLFVTTNLDSRGIRDRYGAPVLDRLLEMCFAVRFSGPSMRVRANKRVRAANLVYAEKVLGVEGGAETDGRAE